MRDGGQNCSATGQNPEGFGGPCNCLLTCVSRYIPSILLKRMECG